ncbi:YfhO family protein, partial [Thermoproteota archaeon]
MFGDVLFSPEQRVFSHKDGDIAKQFIHWRSFGFDQLKRGNLALWNPYIFSGMPYFGESQSALLYPLNIVYLFFPLTKAINISITLHVFLVGLFMLLWTAYRKLHPLACFLSSALLMFCGAHFMHIYAGHLPNLCTMIWAPLLFLSIDGLLDKKSLGWYLLGVTSVTMQILAGHPQYVFYIGICAMLYAGLCAIKIKERAKFIGCFIGIYIGAIALSAVQLFTSMQAASESVRSGGLLYDFASSFSFPIENLITILAPGFFGDNITLTYWGQYYLWEMIIFISVTGFMLTLYAVFNAEKNIRRFAVTMALVCIVLALGRHTPLFKLLYTWIPGFNLFRGSSKFIFPASLFIIMLAGIELDNIRHSK